MRSCLFKILIASSMVKFPSVSINFHEETCRSSSISFNFSRFLNLQQHVDFSILASAIKLVLLELISLSLNFLSRLLLLLFSRREKDF
ncbi:hypothetical protein QL285_033796 [Trifolium repens]|nr:hypothetical protein QL285_033796 [Trifolium repens]